MWMHLLIRARKKEIAINHVIRDISVAVKFYVKENNYSRIMGKKAGKRVYQCEVYSFSS